ncbi:MULTISPECIES: DUF2207 family protein [unclassified Streptomyces]|uniref:DUF2207 family protein n=1 Tax=unclassified Streptomyces TaxID=2593676 RepID=UPI002DDB914C|nr:hypothetical protein [Streptomyces sp. NBC_01257]WRZ63280.1 DUF2207 domain-containing protein [Streptomyces sp. NBC_01257]WSU57255.1 DUF2207 domain-containing protein [Streptomyces sp. NBC_01104]
MTLTEQLYWGGAALIVLWLVAFGFALVATRNGEVTPGPATQEFGDDPEPPAVVSLLGNGWRGVEHAAAATLLDLAARGLVELRQPGDDPARSTVHATEAGRAAAGLPPYEQRVLDRVNARAADGGAPIGAIAFRDAKRAAAWNSSLRQEIIAEARQRGLSRFRYSRLLGSALMFSAFVPGALFTVAAVMGGHNLRAAFAVGVAPGAALAFLLGKSLRERATPEGLERAGHWAGLRAWLTAHEDFARLPPASVTVWDRYLAYGTALGVTSLSSRLLGFDSGDRRRVWSSYGGTWRPVRIRYPRLRPGFGASTKRLLYLAAGLGVFAACVAVYAVLRQPDWSVVVDAQHGDSLRRPGLVLSIGWVGSALLGLVVAGTFNRWTLLVAFLAMMPGNFASGSHGWFVDAAAHEGPLPVEFAAIAVFGALAAYFLVLACLERREAGTITGEVLRMEPRKGREAARFLVLDEGDTDLTTAWALPAASQGIATGAQVRLRVSPATRTIRSAELVRAAMPEGDRARALKQDAP